MITFQEFLAESRSAPLYHGTSGDAVFDILVNDKGIIPGTIHTGSKLLKSNRPIVRGVSATRNFHFAAKYGIGYVLELDQDALSRRYEIIPVNFFTNTQKVARGVSKSHSPVAQYTENEEFILSSTNIPVKYINRLYFPSSWLDGRFPTESRFIQRVREKYGSQFIRTY
jgi:hypothetical protein